MAGGQRLRGKGDRAFPLRSSLLSLYFSRSRDRPADLLKCSAAASGVERRARVIALLGPRRDRQPLRPRQPRIK